MGKDLLLVISIVAGCGGIVLTLASLKRPKLAVWILVLLAPLEVVSLRIGPNVRLYQPLAIIASLSWLGAVCFFHWPIVSNSVLRVMFLWLISGLPSFVVSSSKSDWYEVFLVQIFMWIIVIMINSLVRTWEQAKQFMRIYMSVTVLIAFWGIVQTLAVVLGSNNLGITTSQIRFLNQSARPSGTFLEPNWLAAYLVSPIIFFATLFFVRGNKKYKYSYLSISMGVLLFALLITQTRSSFIGVFFGGLTVFLLNPKRIFAILIKKGILYFILFGIVLLLVITVMPEFLGKLSPKSNIVGVETRLNTWEYAWNVAWRHPITGNGLGAWAHYLGYAKQAGPVITGRIIPNVFLNVFFETGFLGLLCFIMLLLEIFHQTRRAIKKVTFGEQKLWLQAFLAGYVGAIANFVFTNAIRYGFFWVYVALGMCLVQCVNDSYACEHT